MHFLWVSFPPRPETASGKHGYLQYVRHCGLLCQGLRKSGTPLSGTHSVNGRNQNARIVQVQDVFSPVFMGAPTIEVTLSNITSSSLYGSCTETLDAGADACILGISTVDHLSIHLDQVRLCLVRSITTANGSSLYCIGTLVFNVTYCGHSIKVTALGDRDYDSMLLSWAVCQAQRIVLQDYLLPAERESAKVIHAEYSSNKGGVANPSVNSFHLNLMSCFTQGTHCVQWLDPL